MLHFKLFSFILIASIFIIIDTDAQQLSLPGCPKKCGNLMIPFPFGMNSGCYFDDSFHIICNNSYEPPKPFLGSAQVAGISLHGKIRILKSSSSSSSSSSSVLVVVRWAAGEASCHVARKNASRYACQSPHSRCKDSSLGRGHVCHCLPGFHGNPYLFRGCQVIDECASNPCEGVCINMAGSFKCYCPKGSVGDGRKDGTGCHPLDEITPTSLFSFSPIGIFLVAPLLVVTWIAWTDRQKKLQTHREELFEQNGGKLLLSRRRKRQLTLYTDRDLRSITNNYTAASLMQGKRCCPGTFYRGTLPDDDRTEVAVVMVERVPQSQIKHFVDQLIFLSQPLQRNVMRIIGCCLETLPPLIVYELHGDGATTLFDCTRGEARFSCEMRVKAAAGVARGLAYLNSHKYSKTTFVHGNICSANILMDSSFDAKIFYAAGSNLISPPPGRENYVYRDPELIASGRLNSKSDVYSFGVVLVELLTGGRTLSPSRDENDRNMALDFVHLARAGRLREILDEEMAGEGDVEVVREMAVLAERCLNVEPSKRPNMKEVEAKLSKLMPRE